MTKPGGGKDAESQGLHSVSEFVVSGSNSTSSRGHGALVMQQPRISRSHSSDHMSHSKITGSSLSPSTMASSYSHSSVPYSTRSVSSLGYVSDDPLSGNSLLMHSAPDLTHLYPPNSKNSSGTGTGSSGMEFSGNRMYVEKKPVLFHRGQGQSSGQGSDRPTSLGLLDGGRGGGVSGRMPQSKQKLFVCPNCKKTVVYTHEAFEQWFEHIKFCGV